MISRLPDKKKTKELGKKMNTPSMTNKRKTKKMSEDTAGKMPALSQYRGIRTSFVIIQPNYAHHSPC
jgi:hypothetical protein